MVDKRFKAISIYVLSALALAIVGCDKKDGSNSATTTPAAAGSPAATNYTTAAKQIQDDPKMSPELKAVRTQAAKEQFGPGAGGVKPGAPVPAH